MSIVKIALMLGLVAAPLMVICGWTMFRYPMAWAKWNARLARKELSEFNSPRQLERTMWVGKLLMIAGAFELVSMIWLSAMLVHMRYR